MYFFGNYNFFKDCILHTIKYSTDLFQWFYQNLREFTKILVNLREFRKYLNYLKKKLNVFYKFLNKIKNSHFVIISIRFTD
ncbi:hypothetical protein BpHYR1_049647 [Brachionus plicatilis]|uniref:Uncharacterized protein n=1 Tax=Brachionus plicatilis TaxID=10195 RepID=A0A3M7R599_BRAPC|nr:hypothetical protein BpHYR1_049647 [Brachionus plicatilis]